MFARLLRLENHYVERNFHTYWTGGLFHMTGNPNFRKPQQNPKTPSCPFLKNVVSLKSLLFLITHNWIRSDPQKFEITGKSLASNYVLWKKVVEKPKVLTGFLSALRTRIQTSRQ